MRPGFCQKYYYYNVRFKMTGASKTGNMVTTDTPVRISDAWNIGQGSEAKPIDTIDVTPGATPLREYKVRADHPKLKIIINANRIAFIFYKFLHISSMKLNIVCFPVQSDFNKGGQLPTYFKQCQINSYHLKMFALFINRLNLYLNSNIFTTDNDTKL